MGAESGDGSLERKAERLLYAAPPKGVKGVTGWVGCVIGAGSKVRIRKNFLYKICRPFYLRRRTAITQMGGRFF